MVNVGKLWRSRRRDDGEGFEGVVALALTLPSGCALEGASAVKCWWPPRNLFVCRVSPDFERRSSFVDAGWAEFWHRTGSGALRIEQRVAIAANLHARSPHHGLVENLLAIVHEVCVSSMATRRSCTARGSARR